MVRPGGGTLFCAWVSRWAHYRDVATREPARLAARKAFYAQHARDGDYVRVGEEGKAVHAMNHELPAEMPKILSRVTGRGETDVVMVGTEGVLAGGLDKLVNELQGEEFEVCSCACYHWSVSFVVRDVHIHGDSGLGREVLGSRDGQARLDDGRPHRRSTVQAMTIDALFGSSMMHTRKSESLDER